MTLSYTPCRSDLDMNWRTSPRLHHTERPSFQAFHHSKPARTSTGDVICDRCMKIGHLSFGCREYICHRCNQVGHVAKSCRVWIPWNSLITPYMFYNPCTNAKHPESSNSNDEKHQLVSEKREDPFPEPIIDHREDIVFDAHLKEVTSDDQTDFPSDASNDAISQDGSTIQEITPAIYSQEYPLKLPMIIDIEVPTTPSNPDVDDHIHEDQLSKDDQQVSLTSYLDNVNDPIPADSVDSDDEYFSAFGSGIKSSNEANTDHCNSHPSEQEHAPIFDKPTEVPCPQNHINSPSLSPEETAESESEDSPTDPIFYEQTGKQIWCYNCGRDNHDVIDCKYKKDAFRVNFKLHTRGPWDVDDYEDCNEGNTDEDYNESDEDSNWQLEGVVSMMELKRYED